MSAKEALMRRTMVLIALLLAVAVSVSAVDIGAVYTKEMRGLQRDFFGITLRSVGEGFIGFDLMVITPQLEEFASPIDAFSHLIGHVEDIEYVQILPFLLVNLNLGSLGVYGGLAPMIDLRYDKVEEVEAEVDEGPAPTRQLKISLYSPYMFYVKAGAQFNIAFLGAFVEAGTLIDLSFQSAFDTFHLSAGLVLNF